MDLKPFFKQYEELRGQVDSVFGRVKNSHPEGVKCSVGCADCCYALFDLTLVEAVYINTYFHENMDKSLKEKILGEAGVVDRHVHKIKRAAYKDFERGKKEDEIMLSLAEMRVRCVMLDDQNRCAIYSFRPLTCRLYGIPVSIGGKGHTCGLSGFKEGVSYPTTNLDVIHSNLYSISRNLTLGIKSKYSKLHDLLAPLSMVVLTDYNEDYLGVKEDSQKND